jgi:hypothetical protein
MAGAQTRNSTRGASRRSSAATKATVRADKTGTNSRATGSGQTDSGQTYAATFRLPFLTAHFEVPKLSRSKLPALPSRPHLPKLRAPDLSSPRHLGPVTVPSPRKSAYYLGLGALAVAEVVDWPVAAAIAAGTYVAQHTRGSEPALPQVDTDELTRSDG